MQVVDEVSWRRAVRLRAERTGHGTNTHDVASHGKLRLLVSRRRARRRVRDGRGAQSGAPRARERGKTGRVRRRSDVGRRQQPGPHRGHDGEPARLLRERFAERAATGETPSLDYLARSGGGQYGAFAAGVLNGWSETGTCPVFEGVSGISTRSIIAPFAFLGEDSDDVLEEIYTTTSTGDMLLPTIMSGLLFGSALADTTPLRDVPPQGQRPENDADV
jgi:hypothetical protein